MMKPKLEILSKAQLKVWPLLREIPANFILYGGTAIALQIGHRESVDFDFFSASPLDRNKLLSEVSFLNRSRLVQPEINTLDCYLEIDNETVKFQFLTGLNKRQGRVENPLICEDNKLQVASLRDLFATKLNTIQMRAEIKDYIDIDALLNNGLSLTDGLACARAIYGPLFDPSTSLRALCSYQDGDLPQINPSIRERLMKASLEIDTIPTVKPKSPTV